MSDPNLLDFLFFFSTLALVLHSKNPKDFQECQTLQYAFET